MKCPVCENDLVIVPADQRKKYANCTKCGRCGFGMTPAAWKRAVKLHKEHVLRRNHLSEIEAENGRLKVRLSESREMLARSISEDGGATERQPLPPSRIGELVDGVVKRAVVLSLCNQQGVEAAKEHLQREPAHRAPAGKHKGE